MKVAIVGPEESKWTKEQKEKAYFEIKHIFGFHASNFPNKPKKYSDLTLVSGHCPKGGVDIWAEEIADKLGIKKEIYPAQVNQWEDDIVDDGCPPQMIHYKRKKGYKSRNTQIAEACDVLFCIIPSTPLIDERFVFETIENRKRKCKHCKVDGHPTNGGCWTKKAAEKLGKKTHLVIIE